MNETWLQVPGHSLYEVSDQGRIRSYAHPRGRTAVHLLKPSLDDHGYQAVRVKSDAGRVTRWRMHQLIIHVFVGPQEPGTHVRHLNGIDTDNRLSNLAYGTPSENALDQVAHGTHNMASRTHCKQGHEYTPENTYLGVGFRRCRKCQLSYQRTWKAKRQETA